MIAVAAVGSVAAAIVALAVMLFGGVDAEVPPTADEPATQPITEPATEPERATMPLTGIATDEVPERPAMIVKVSNSPEARPQTGLELADVVFEEVTEGGITRFFAVFHSQLTEVVGPVRSARPVDVQLMSGFGHPGFAYSGARPEVQTMLAGAGAVTITEGAAGFFRDDGAYASHPIAPHDLFVRLEDVLAAVTDAGARPLSDLGWAFQDEPPAGGASGGEVLEVAMSDAYLAGWTYDAIAGLYRRDQNGAPFTVTGSGGIGAANVVVIDARHYVGASGYPETDVVGAGDAIVLRDGQRYAAQWSKPTSTDPLLVLTADGTAPFPLRPGPTWVHLPDELPTS